MAQRIVISGAGEYACSNNVGDWTTSFPFRDPVTNGSIVTRITVSLLGSYACSGGTMQLEADINGFPVNIEQRTGSGCACNTCDGEWMLAGSFPPEVAPFYNYGQTNNITLKVVNNQLCLNSVNITVYWDLPRMFVASLLEAVPLTRSLTHSLDARRDGRFGGCNHGHDLYHLAIVPRVWFLRIQQPGLHVVLVLRSAARGSAVDPSLRTVLWSILLLQLVAGRSFDHCLARWYHRWNRQTYASHSPHFASKQAIAIEFSTSVNARISTPLVPSKAYSSTCTNPYQCDGGVWSSPYVPTHFRLMSAMCTHRSRLTNSHCSLSNTARWSTNWDGRPMPTTRPTPSRSPRRSTRVSVGSRCSWSTTL